MGGGEGAERRSSGRTFLSHPLPPHTHTPPSTGRVSYELELMDKAEKDSHREHASIARKIGEAIEGFEF